MQESSFTLMFRGMHYFGIVFQFEGYGFFKLLLTGLTFFCITGWVYRGMRNLRGMGLHSHLEPNWVIASWIIAPLLIVTFPMSVRDMIDKNCRIYDLLGRKPKVKMPRKSFYHKLFTHWWYSFWMSHLILIFGLNTVVADSIYRSGNVVFFSKLVLLFGTLTLVLLPLLLGARFLYRFGAIEAAVLQIGDSGVLENWRDNKLQSGQLHADKSEAPEWYREEKDLSMEMPEGYIFRDQGSPKRPNIGPA
jgi:hypothetical protein